MQCLFEGGIYIRKYDIFTVIHVCVHCVCILFRTNMYLFIANSVLFFLGGIIFGGKLLITFNVSFYSRHQVLICRYIHCTCTCPCICLCDMLPEFYVPMLDHAEYQYAR